MTARHRVLATGLMAAALCGGGAAGFVLGSHRGDCACARIVVPRPFSVQRVRHELARLLGLDQEELGEPDSAYPALGLYRLLYRWWEIAPRATLSVDGWLLGVEEVNEDESVRTDQASGKTELVRTRYILSPPSEMHVIRMWAKAEPDMQ